MTVQRENRYIVIKRSDLDKLSPLDKDVAVSNLEHVEAIMFGCNVPERQCLVIESDWPEYEPAWEMIKARVSGAQVKCQHDYGRLEGTTVNPYCTKCGNIHPGFKEWLKNKDNPEVGS